LACGRSGLSGARVTGVDGKGGGDSFIIGRVSGRAEGGELAGLLAEAAAGRFPAADGGVTIMAPPSERDAGVIGFCAHAVIFTDAEPRWVAAQLPAGDLTGPLSVGFLAALGERTGRVVHTIELLCAAAALPGRPEIALSREADLGHPRVARALRFRDDVMAWRARGGVVVLGRGVAGRWEASVEVDPGQRGRGLGRALATAARHLVPDGEAVWAQIAPANVPSVRAFLSGGFRPVGAEALLTRTALRA
jgi:GNAT superfamily N-acetyltransferase